MTRAYTLSHALSRCSTWLPDQAEARWTIQGIWNAPKGFAVVCAKRFYSGLLNLWYRWRSLLRCQHSLWIILNGHIRSMVGNVKV